MPRTLTQQEFNAIRDEVLNRAPAGLSAEEFERYIGPETEKAIAIAENTSAPLQGSSLRRAMSGLWSTINPINIAGGLYQAARHPVETATGIVQAHGEQLGKAGEAFRAGRYSEAAGHGAAGILPLVGPAAAHIGERMAETGDVATGLGAATGLIAPAVLTRPVVNAVKSSVKSSVQAPQNPALRSAVEFGQQQGIPLDAATATGNRFIASAQKRVSDSFGGAGVAEGFKAEQAAALTKTGRGLAERVHPEVVSPEQAGASVRGAVQGQVSAMHGEASKAYEGLRQIEQQVTRDVPKTIPEPVKVAMRRSVGRAVSDPEIRELRRIGREMETLGYQKGGLVQESLDDSATYYVRGKAGASVYNDILQAAPGTADMTRGDVLRSINTALETGEFSNAARGALDVARLRLAGKTGKVSQPLLPPSAGDVTESMQMPVDLRTVKSSLRPVYERMTRQLPITQQRSSPGLKAIQNILDGPDYAPVSQVDTDLGAIKAISRGADLPELRDVSQGLAAQAVKQLDEAVREAAGQGGRQAVDFLETGRAATKAKYGAADVLKQIWEEPVQAFEQMVYSRDAGLGQLRKIQELAPSEMPKVGRAFLDDLLDKATAEGGFDRAKGLASQWQNMGPGTKAILFGDRAHIKSLDQFFLLAKKIGENPNPSGTARVATAFNVASGAMGYPLAKLFYSPAGVRLLTRGLQIPAANARATSAWLTEVRRVGGVAARSMPSLNTPGASEAGSTP